MLVTFRCHRNQCITFADDLSSKDVIKTQYQNNLSHSNPIFTLKYLYKTEGTSFLTRGILSNSLRGIPQSGALFLGYELTMNSLKC